MRNLVFNLLRDTARTAGCEDDVWEVVTEFAAAEALLERVTQGAADAQDEVRVRTFLLAAEALYSCMGGGVPAGAPGARLRPSTAPRSN